MAEDDAENRRKLLRPRGFEPRPCGLGVARLIRRFLSKKALKYSVFGENETTGGLPQQSIFKQDFAGFEMDSVP